MIDGIHDRVLRFHGVAYASLIFIIEIRSVILRRQGKPLVYHDLHLAIPVKASRKLLLQSVYILFMQGMRAVDIHVNLRPRGRHRDTRHAHIGKHILYLSGCRLIRIKYFKERLF